MKRRRPTPTRAPRPITPIKPESVANTAKPEIRYFSRQPNGVVEVRTKPWVRPMNREAIREWIGEYMDRVKEGYVPAGLDFAPIPFAARITLSGRVVAEWSKPKSVQP